MPLDVILKPYTLEHPHLEQKFLTGDLVLSFDAALELGNGCGNALWALLAAHVSNSKLDSMSDDLHHMNTKAIEGHGDQVVTMGRIGNSRNILIAVTDQVHSDSASTRIDVMEV